MANWISLAGVAIALAAFLIGCVFMVVDMLQERSQAYVGIFAYLLVPGFLVLGAGMTVVGMLRQKRLMKRRGSPVAMPVIDLGHRGTLARILGVLILLLIFAFVSAVASYHAYHFTESVEFCGTVCHTVMKPEHTAHMNSPHGRVTCTECHIGSGAQWFVKSKLTGLYQVYAVLFNKYDRPIKAPVHSLRPAKDTCEACHWPQKFFGAVLRTWTYFLPDEANSPWTVKMLVNIGGGSPEHGRVNGVHWHMNEVNTIEYIATDEKRLVIPWMRVTNQDGDVTVYKTEDEDIALTEGEITTLPKRTMDCIDCHNRPTHQYKSPNESLDMALLAGTLDASMPELKYAAGELLADTYETEAEALEAIETGLRKRYASHAGLEQAIQTLTAIYQRNFFPEMKVRWEEYPNHIGHKITPGCFRCHDGKHVSETGERISRDCTVCHTILAQGPGTELNEMASAGLAFQHPEDIDGEWKTERCDTCHTGSP